MHFLLPIFLIGLITFFHSLGEYAALVIAGVISVQGALTIIANRVRFMISKCVVESTGMIAVNASEEVVIEAINSSPDFSGLSIACYNSATDCVISGPIPQIKAFKVHLDAEVHCKNVLLSVPFGYHSSAMEPLLQDLTAVASKITIKAPIIPIISNVFGDVVIPGDDTVFNAAYFARHCAEPVQFDKGIRCLVSRAEFSKVDAWLEIGPHTTTLPMLKANASLAKDTLLLGSLKKQQSAWSMLVSSAAQLYLTGIPIQWRQAFSHVDVTCIDLPSYPFARNKFWVAFKEPEVVAPVPVVQTAPTPTNLIHEFKMLNSWAQYPSKANGNVAIFETPISDLADSIRGHAVGGIPLCPASVYVEQVLAGVELAKHHLGFRLDGQHPVLRKIEFSKPLVYDASVARIVTTSVSLKDDRGVFSVSSRVGNSEELVHVHGEYRFQTVSETANKFNRVFPVISRQMNAVQEPRSGELPEVFSTRTAYEVIFPRVVDYSKEYHTMQSLTVDPSGMEGVASVKLPVDHDKGSYVAHPVFMDTLLHVAGFVANMQGGINDAYICSEVGTVKVIPELIDNNASYTVYINNSWVESEGVTIAEAYAVLDSNPRRIVAHLKGMHFRLLRLNSLKKSLAHAAGKTTQNAQPRAIPAAASRVPAAPMPVTVIPKVPSVNVSGEIINIVAETCDISAASVDVNTDLSSLGVDSLMSIEIFGKLQALFSNVELDAHALSHCENVSGIISEVSKLLKDLPAAQSSSTSVPSTAITPAASTTASSSSSTVDVAALVSRIVSDTCDISLSAIGLDTDLNSLGVDSLMSIEIFGKLEESFPNVALDATVLSHCHSISDIVKHISISSAPPSESSDSSSPRTLVAVELPEPPRLNVNGPDVKQLLASVLDISVKDITDDADFEDLGLDSLTSIEALGALKGEFDIDLPGEFFYSYKTARAVQSYLAAHIRV